MSRRRTPSANTSTESAGWLPRTTESGWLTRTWRSGRPPTTRRRNGSRSASGATPTIGPSGARGSTGRCGRIGSTRAALKHLPAGLATPAEVHRLSAWLASRCGDVEGERNELAARVAEAPEDFEALERLETLERQSAKSPSARPRRRREEIERDQKRYRELYRRNQPARDAEEMASLAERLGHRFEAILYLTAAIAEDPDRADLRVHLHRFGESAREPGEANRSLFDELRSD